jgi:hypothetical protein
VREHIIDGFEFWGVNHAFLSLWHPAGVAWRRSRYARPDVRLFCGKLADNLSSPFFARMCQLKAMKVISMAHFAAPAASSTPPLPQGPVLTLPAGVVGVLNAGRVYGYDRWLMAVGVCPDLFIVLTCVSERQVPAVLREQLAGYLAACGVQVVRLRLRFPVGWHVRGSLARTLVFWIFRCVENLSISLPPRLGIDRPRLALSIRGQAEQAQEEWEWLGRIWRSMEDEFPAALPQLDSLLWEISHGWEVRWALILRDAVQYGYISAADQADVERCDRAWIMLIQRYLVPRGYKVLPTTMARLL